MSIAVFLSTVTDEFRAYRDQLRGDLTRHNVGVKVQEDFKGLGGDTLGKLDTYIAHCDAVVHLVGDMTGSAPLGAEQQAWLRDHSDVAAKLPPLAEALRDGAEISYTQWEAWLALYHGKLLLTAKADPLAPRDARHAPTDVSQAAQAAHLRRLEERTRDRVPLNWAMTQNNLGSALSMLGERESGTARLEEAVAAYRAALEERTRDRVPLDWAATQNNLGNALQTLGERESGTARLEEAVAAYRAALEERTRDRVPLDWAQSQHNLANVLATLAERTGDRARMGEAVAAMRNAAEVYREGNVTYWLSIAEGLIAAMQAALAKMGS